MRFPSTFVPGFALLAGACLLVLFYRGLRRRRQAAAVGPPARGAGHGPGRAILAESEQVAQEIGDVTSGTLAFMALFVGVVVAGAAFGEPETRLGSAALSFVIGAAFFGGSLTHLLRLRRVRAELVRCYNGRMEVVRALNSLEPNGYRIFHDVSGDGLSVHHVVVGRNGVFAVETTSGFGPPRAKGGGNATVTYNGHVLFFPRRTDDRTVRRAEERAERLAQWLQQGVGEAVAVRAVVVVPGWFVKRTNPEGIPVVHPSQVASLFKYIKSQPLSGELLGCVVHRLEQGA
ncbi:MAG: NERD domain-containing protein [Desulfobacteraceae bacterium]|nr:MAG: NERD domain-containing protein [Desulfobacteraceae bacterium]